MSASSTDLQAEIVYLRQRLAELETRVRESRPDAFAIELNGMPLRWDLRNGVVNLFELPSVTFWLNPSLIRMLEPLIAEAGVTLARLLIAHYSSLGTEEDYHTMISTLGNTFEEGFLAWGRAVGTAGWGTFELPAFDREAQKATVVVRQPWELVMQRDSTTKWGCPFLQGKVIGIFSQALGTNCWANEQTVMQPEPVVTFEVYASERTITDELAALRDQRQLEFEQQRELMRELATPLIPITDQIVIMPLIGTIDPWRVQQIMEALLEGVSRYRAELVILDITGVSIVDTNVAQGLVQAARAVRLLGTQVMLTGIQPQIAQTIVHLGIDLSEIRTHSSLQAGIQEALHQ